MENRLHIEQELKELSPIVAGLPVSLPYQVPEGYFDQLPDRLCELLKEPAVDFLPGPAQSAYQVPDGYFSSLPNQILSRVKALQSDSAAEETAALSPLLGSISRQQPYSLPENYFDNLLQETEEAAKAIDIVNEELENLPDWLAALKHKATYQSPEGYFEGLPSRMLDKAIAVKQPARVISFRSRILQFAAAAVLVMAFMSAAFLYWQQGKVSNQPLALQKEMAAIPDTVLENYLNTQSSRIGETSVIASNPDEIGQDDMGDLLADVSDAELQHYLEANGVNSPLLTN
jgi:hypothetical protein